MTFSRGVRSRAIPRWTLAALTGSILPSMAVDVMLATLDYRSLDTYYRTRGLTASEVLGSLSDHVLWGLREGWFLSLVVVVGYVLARRGRRWLFAGPALGFVLAPFLVGLLRGTPATPGFGLYGWLARESEAWVSWMVTGVRVFILLLPGFIVARHAEQERNPFRIPALLLVAIPALVAGYLAVLVLSPTGRIQDSPLGPFLAAFFLGAAMGFDRPLWPWFLVAIPALFEGWSALLVTGDGNGAVVVLITLVGAASVPFSRILYRGWRQNAAPGSPHEPVSSAG